MRVLFVLGLSVCLSRSNWKLLIISRFRYELNTQDMFRSLKCCFLFIYFYFFIFLFWDNF